MAPSSKLGRGKPLKNQTKELLHKIYMYFETEIERDPNSTVTAAQLVTHSTGISLNAIKRVILEYKNNAIVKKECKSNRRKCKKNLTSDIFDAQAIRRFIHGFYNKDEEFPIMKDLFMLLKADIDYQGSISTLRRHVARMGFKWMENEDSNNILIEKHNVRFARVQYLSHIEGYRCQGRNIVYTGEVAIETNRVATKPKADGSSTILKQPAKSRLIVLLAGDQNEILINTYFSYDSSKREVKEEHESKRDNFERYEKWFKFQLMPNLKPNSVVIVDGCIPFHNRLSNPPPHVNSSKKDMMDYLTERHVPYSTDMYKPQLYQLVLLHKDKHYVYKTDLLLKEHGHTVLRIPPCHPDLNPIRNVLSSVRSYFENDCLSLETVMKISLDKVTSLSPEDWTEACRATEAEENSLKATDKVIDEITELMFTNIEDGSSDSDGDDDNGSDQDSMDSD